LGYDQKIRMKILTLTSLFPNSIQPIHGIFVKARVEALARLAYVKVVAPVPWGPRFMPIKRYRPYARIPSVEYQNGLVVYHPRFLIIPKIGRAFYGYMYHS